MSKQKVKLKANVYEIVSRAIDEGAKVGYNRAYKHTDHPGKDTILEWIHGEIMNSLCEVIKFDA